MKKSKETKSNVLSSLQIWKNSKFKFKKHKDSYPVNTNTKKVQSKTSGIKYSMRLPMSILTLESAKSKRINLMNNYSYLKKEMNCY